MTNPEKEAIQQVKVSEGDFVQITCAIFSQVFRSIDDNKLKGIVQEVFWIEDSHVQIDIKNNHQRFRWDSKRDGGTFEVLNTQKKA